MPDPLLGVAGPCRRDLLRALGNCRARPLGSVRGSCRSVGRLPHPLPAEFGKAFGLPLGGLPLGGLAAARPIWVVRAIAAVVVARPLRPPFRPPARLCLLCPATPPA